MSPGIKANEDWSCILAEPVTNGSSPGARTQVLAKAPRRRIQSRRPTMNCQQVKPLIDPYADGELEAATILELEQHLKNCSACALAWRNLQDLKKALKQDALYFTAPAELRQRVKAELHSPAKAVPWRQAWNWNWLTATLSGTVAVCLALLLTATL